MRTITVNGSGPVNQQFQSCAENTARKTSELIREAMEIHRQLHPHGQTGLSEINPTSVGGPIQPITSDDDLFGDMLEDDSESSPSSDSKTRILAFAPILLKLES